ncbi:hypothetical protein TNCV_1738061 [Trichonephila clavipes]|nr:hypothetical protein TNCV_1738061 [Trichonephila clavipes]
MGCRLSLTIMVARLDVVTPRVLTINNDPMATYTGHFTVGGSIKFRNNRWVPKASLVLIYRPNVAGMKGRVNLAQPVNRTPDLWRGSTIHYHSILFGEK